MTYIPNTSATQGESVVGATNALDGAYYFADPSGGDFTITLPAAPDDNTTVNVKHIGASGEITVDGNGNNIDGESEVKITFQYDSFIFVFNTALGAWFLV